MAETIIDRIRFLIDRSHKSQAAFARRLSIDPSNMSKHLSGRLPVTDGLINRIVADLGVSKQWLTTGQGLPYDKSLHAVEIVQGEECRGMDTATSEATPHGIPVYDIDVTAGCAELSRMFTRDRIIGFVDLPQLNPESRIVRVSGDSMAPVINHGAYIAVRHISDPGIIFWGQIYVIVLDDYRMVKFLRRDCGDASKVILHSANASYDDMEVVKSDIRQLYLVETILNYDIRC